MDIIEKFSKNLINVTYPNEKEAWNIAGILNNSNEYLKFDVRDMFNLSDGRLGKNVKANNLVDKIVFEAKNDWIILDQKEFNKFLIKTKLKIIEIETLTKELDWTIIISKE